MSSIPVFLFPDVETDPAVLKDRAIARIEELLPGWTYKADTVDGAIIDAFSYHAADQAEVLSEGLVNFFRAMGPLAGVPPLEAVPATALVTFTLSDAEGHTVEAGTTVGVRDANGELQAFRLRADVVVPAESTTGAGLAEALNAGELANDLSGVAELVEAPQYVALASLAASGGGKDAEGDLDFLNRLAETLALMMPGPVRAEDAAVLARRVAGVGRAAAVDNLKPGAGDGGSGVEETEVEKCVTIAVTDDVTFAAGDAELRARVLAALQARREDSLLFFVVAPHYNVVDAATTVYAWPGSDLAVVKVGVEEALNAFLSPANFAPDASGRRWSGDSVVRQAAGYGAIGSVAGVRWASTLTFALHGGALSDADLHLGGGSAIPALPQPGTVNVTVLAS